MRRDVLAVDRHGAIGAAPDAGPGEPEAAERVTAEADATLSGRHAKLLALVLMAVSGLAAIGILAGAVLLLRHLA
jgi:hypothetical protein